MARNSPSHRSPSQLRLLAFVHVGRFVTLATAFGFALVAMVLDNPNWLFVAGAALFIWTVLALVHLAEAARTRCAVCAAPLFDRTTCAKHREASKTLGGYRLHTALQVLGTSHYDCHHCGEHVFCGLAEASPKTAKRRQSRRPSGTPINRLPARRDELTLHKTNSDSFQGRGRF